MLADSLTISYYMPFVLCTISSQFCSSTPLPAGQAVATCCTGSHAIDDMPALLLNTSRTKCLTGAAIQTLHVANHCTFLSKARSVLRIAIRVHNRFTFRIGRNTGGVMSLKVAEASPGGTFEFGNVISQPFLLYNSIHEV